MYFCAAIKVAAGAPPRQQGGAGKAALEEVHEFGSERQDALNTLPVAGIAERLLGHPLQVLAHLGLGWNGRAARETKGKRSLFDGVMNVRLYTRGKQCGGAARNAVTENIHALRRAAGGTSETSSGVSNGQTASVGCPSHASRNRR